jgi:hypothetical protein
VDRGRDPLLSVHSFGEADVVGVSMGDADLMARAPHRWSGSILAVGVGFEPTRGLHP